MNCKDVLFIGSASIFIGLQIFTTYVGFVAFFYASLQIIFSYMLALISNCLTKDWFSFISNFFWLFASIPYIHLIVVINAEIIKSYFKNIWKALDLKKAENRLRQFFRNKKWCSKENRVDRWGFLYLFSVLMNGIFVIIELTTSTDQTVCSLSFAGLSCYPPLFACIVVLIKSIPIYKHGSHEQTSAFSDDGVISQSFYSSEQSIENVSLDYSANKDENLSNEDSLNKPLNAEDSLIPNNKSNKVQKWQVYFDPCQIIIQKDIIEFINDPKVNDYRYIYYNHKIIPSFFITAIFIEYTIYLIYKFIAIDRKRDLVDILFVVIRIAYSFLSFRFLIIFNFVNFFINFSTIRKKHKSIWFTYLAAISISIVILIAVGLGLIIVHKVFSPFQLNEFHYSPVYENVTFGPQSSVCQTKFYDLDLVQYAGIASFGQSKNEAIAREISKMLFNNQEFPIVSIDNPILHMYTIRLNESFTIRVFESLTDKKSVSFMLDLFMNDFVINRMSYGTIPFYYITIEIFLYRYLHFVTMTMNRYLLMDLIYSFAYFANHLYTGYDKEHYGNSTIIYVGHSIGGLIAKGIGSKRNVPSVAFECLEYYHSLFHMTINSDTGVGFSSEKLKMMNIYSPTQIFSEVEKTAMINVNLPKWKEIYQFTNAYETFCMVAAGCATDARYDQFCNAVIGKNNFLNLFRLWNRSRSDNI